MRGPRWVCQNGISDGQKDGRNRDGFLYSDRKIDRWWEAVRCQLRRWEEGGECSCNRATGRRPRGWREEVVWGKVVQTLETTD